MTSLGTYLNCLHGAEPDGAYVELRWRLRHGRGMGREFVAIRDPRLAGAIQARGRETDLYVGVSPRSRLEGTRGAVEHCHVLFVDCDTPKSIAALDAFQPAPSMVVNSGHGRHAYWSLWPPVGPDELERANRRLAHALGADMRATDAARILRPPGTFNHKSATPVPVTLEQLRVEIFTADEVAGHLPDPTVARAPSPAPRIQASHDPLDEIPPPVYFEALTGLVPGRDGKACCPLPGHEDSTPSMHVYDEPGAGWHCFGCGRGGTVYTLAALLAGYSLPLRGADFLAVRGVLLEHLTVQAAA